MTVNPLSHCHHTVFVDICCCFTLGSLLQVLSSGLGPTEMEGHSRKQWLLLDLQSFTLELLTSQI